MPKRKRQRAKKSPQPPTRGFRLNPERRKLDPQELADIFLDIATRMVAEREGTLVDPTTLNHLTMYGNASSNLPSKKKTD